MLLPYIHCTCMYILYIHDMYMYGIQCMYMYNTCIDMYMYEASALLRRSRKSACIHVKYPLQTGLKLVLLQVCVRMWVSMYVCACACTHAHVCISSESLLSSFHQCQSSYQEPQDATTVAIVTTMAADTARNTNVCSGVCVCVGGGGG